MKILLTLVLAFSLLTVAFDASATIPQRPGGKILAKVNSDSELREQLKRLGLGSQKERSHSDVNERSRR